MQIQLKKVISTANSQCSFVWGLLHQVCNIHEFFQASWPFDLEQRQQIAEDKDRPWPVLRVADTSWAPLSSPSGWWSSQKQNGGYMRTVFMKLSAYISAYMAKMAQTSNWGSVQGPLEFTNLRIAHWHTSSCASSESICTAHIQL